MKILNWYQLSNLHNFCQNHNDMIVLAAGGWGFDWSKIDWSQSTKDIAASLKLDQAYISNRRRKYAPETVRPVKSYTPSGIDWSNIHIDWTNGNREILEQFGLDDRYMDIIRKMRRKLAPETIEAENHFNSNKVDWSKVDWDKSNDEIAVQIGASSNWVSRARNAAFPEYSWAHTEWGKKRKKNNDWSKVDWSKSTKDISAEMGVDNSTTSIQRRRYAPQTVTPVNVPRISI